MVVCVGDTSFSFKVPVPVKDDEIYPKQHLNKAHCRLSKVKTIKESERKRLNWDFNADELI